MRRRITTLSPAPDPPICGYRVTQAEDGNRGGTPMALSRTGRLDAVVVLLVVISWQARSQQSVGAGQDSLPPGRYTLATCVNAFTPSRVESTRAGYQYWFVDKDFLDGRTLKMSVVKPHAATHPPHHHAEDEIFFVLEGTAEVFLNGEKTVVRPCTSFYCPPNSEHGIRNAGDAELKYLVIKKYAKN